MFGRQRRNIDNVLNSHDKNRLKAEAIKISVLYTAIGLFWVISTTWISSKLANDKNILAIVETYKDWAFVIVTSILLYTLIKSVFKAVYLEDKKLDESYEELSTLHEELEAKNEELTASEEELKAQVDELDLSGQMLSESRRRLRKAQTIASVGNWEFDIISKNRLDFCRNL